MEYLTNTHIGALKPQSPITREQAEQMGLVWDEVVRRRIIVPKPKDQNATTAGTAKGRDVADGDKPATGI